ncbi:MULTISPECIES: proline dehydrogenase family protein [Catenuloplanes]|uniref:proline dehydrogenase n=1 Tax=Catenuloplanes niger TaxID=587534 RepID=A0AAE3ZQ81_9ACTN|nr:proline dehydrogenase family protein [Catenuloplanes niger]MDR7324064.1 proline dehydrogenase [Catenuloplanes niger]
MLRSAILAASRSPRLENLVSKAPFGRDLARRFVAGDGVADAIRVATELAADGLSTTVEHLGPTAATEAGAHAARDEYRRLLRGIADAGLSDSAEVSVKLSALGRSVDEHLARELARDVCAAAVEAGTTVTVDMEESTATDFVLDTVGKLRGDVPSTGVAVQAYLRRAEADCRELSHPGSRVRLCKGAYPEPEPVAWQAALEVDKSFVRCLNALLSGPAYPMVATHDARLIAIAEDRARWFDRPAGEFEFQMLHGVRPAEQTRLAAEGYTVRVYLPYGTHWYGYLARRLAERPGSAAFLGRALTNRR